MDLWLATKSVRLFLHFSSVIGSLVYVLSKMPRDRMLQKRSLLFFALAVLSLFVTCKNFISSTLEDFLSYPDAYTRLKNSEPAVKAFAELIESQAGFWWFSHLHCFLLSFIVFLNLKSRFIGMSTLELCSYTWLGLSGFVSVALLLFMTRYSTAVQDRTKTASPWRLPTWGMDILGICLWVSFWCMVSLPLNKDTRARLYLSTIHLFLFAPSLIPSNPIKRGTDHTMLSPVLTGTVVLLTGQYWHQSFKVVTELHFNWQDFLLEGFANSSQSSTFFDLIFCFIALVFYAALECNFGLSLLALFTFVTPLLSFGSTFALFMIFECYNLRRAFSLTTKID